MGHPQVFEVVALEGTKKAVEEKNADGCAIGADEGSGSVSVRDAGEDCVGGECDQLECGCGPGKSFAGATGDRRAEGTGGERLVRPGDYGSGGDAAGPVLFCGVGCDAGVFGAPGLFP